MVFFKINYFHIYIYIHDGDESARHGRLNGRRSHVWDGAQDHQRRKWRWPKAILQQRKRQRVNQVRLDRRNESILKRGLVVG